MKKRKRPNKQERRLAEKKSVRKAKFKAISIICFLGILIFQLPIERMLLRRFGTCTVARIVEQQKHRRRAKDTFLYEFAANGKYYTGDSKRPDRKEVGNNIHIIYLPLYPSITAPASYINNTDTCYSQ